MYWVRSNRRFGSWAALLALAIQLVLSFGHIHIEDTQSPTTVVAAQSQAQPNAPADDDDDRGFGPHHFCAICATLSLTASSVLPAVELPAIPVARHHKWGVDVRRVRVSYGVLFSFQARAPPYST
ncbi:MAG TPA: DUF2946 family protein [Pseudolabrys sp.]